MWTLCLVVAAGAAPVHGERLSFVAEWMGITAGTAVAETRSRGDSWVFEVRSKSAGWRAGLYPVDDRLSSTWSAATGSSRYETVFREGRFQQDQVMLFDGESVFVSRRQLFDEGWRSWDDRYVSAGALEDPVSALWRLREEGEGTYQVFSGKKALPVVVVGAGAEEVGGVRAHRLDVRTVHDGDLKDRMSVWISADGDALPLRAVVATRAGPVTVRLTGREVLP